MSKTDIDKLYVDSDIESEVETDDDESENGGIINKFIKKNVVGGSNDFMDSDEENDEEEEEDEYLHESARQGEYYNDVDDEEIDKKIAENIMKAQGEQKNSNKSKSNSKNDEQEEIQIDVNNSNFIAQISDDLDEDDEEEDEDYLQKITEQMKENIITEYHPELKAFNNDEVEAACNIIRGENGDIIDPLHRTLPFVTKYEKARIIGERAKQINSGAKPFIEVDKKIHDGYLIALKEYEDKKIPFIVRRPLPNGTFEFWRLHDLDILE